MALLGSLFADAERGADLGPRTAGGPSLLDEVVEQLVSQLGQLLLLAPRAGQQGERLEALRVDSGLGNEFIERHSSTIT